MNNERHIEASDLAQMLADKLREIAKTDPIQGVYLEPEIRSAQELAIRMGRLAEMQSARAAA